METAEYQIIVNYLGFLQNNAVFLLSVLWNSEKELFLSRMFVFEKTTRILRNERRKKFKKPV